MKNNTSLWKAITPKRIVLILLSPFVCSNIDAQVWNGSATSTTTNDWAVVGKFLHVGSIPGLVALPMPTVNVVSNAEETQNLISLSITNLQSPEAFVNNNIVQVYRGDMSAPPPQVYESTFIISPSGKVGMNLQPDETKDYRLEVGGAATFEEHVNIGDRDLNYGGDFILNVNGKTNFTDKVVIGNSSLNHNHPAHDYNLYVEKGMMAEKVRVELSGNWPDYVFEDNYALSPLSEVEEYIKENKHLPEVPSAKDVAANGIDLGDMDAKLLRKVEELTLYLIDLKKENESLRARIENLEK